MSIMKKIALVFPPLRRVYVDLENRRRRVNELEGHIPILKKQLARAIKGGKSGKVDNSAMTSDINYLRSERDKLLEQNDILNDKYDALYKDYCILSMSNEALLKTNASLVDGGFAKVDKQKRKTKTVKKKPPATRRTSKAKASGA